MAHRELHRASRIGWLRATVLGANDGIVSTASLMVGVAAADSGRAAVLVAGVAGTSLICLIVLGALAAQAGGASTIVGAARVAVWGVAAMAVTAGIGTLFGAVV